jgi:NAD-dependent dihydropyrimidine dehydrogenase PreA subunit
VAQVFVDSSRCEGKRDCVKVCPEAVFALRKPTAETTPLFARIRTFFHGGKQAFVVREADCSACMKCVDACPEKAIQVFPDRLAR